jgi:hypothetical protein
MKNNPQLKAYLAALCFALSASTVQAQPVSPATGMPVTVSVSQYPAPAAIDPATGLPVATEWRDPDWKDPDKVLDSVSYVGLPISEVARQLSEVFTNDFDFILPQDFGAHTQNGQADWLSTPVHLQLKNVTASEVFNAMNLLFENNRAPLRWELKMNGHRRTVLLQVLEDPKPSNASSGPQARAVYYVGDLIGEKETMNDVADTIQSVWRLAYNSNDKVIQYHEQTQLIIVTGTADEINFIRQTIEALRFKMNAELERRSEATHKASGVQQSDTGSGVK